MPNEQTPVFDPSKFEVFTTPKSADLVFDPTKFQEYTVEETLTLEPVKFDPIKFEATYETVAPVSTLDVKAKGEFPEIIFSRLEVKNVLEENKDKAFVKRILDPSIVKPIKDQGYEVTHLMAYADNIVFPTVVLKEGKLINLEKLNIDPYEYAIKNNNFITMDNEADAEAFSVDYKKIWKKPGLGDQVEEATSLMPVRQEEISKKGIKFYKKSLKDIAEETAYIFEPLERALEPTLKDDLNVRLKKELTLLLYMGLLIPREVVRDPKELAKGIAEYYGSVLWNWRMVSDPFTPDQAARIRSMKDIQRSPIFNILPLLPIGLKGLKGLKGKSKAEINKIATTEAQRVVDHAKKHPELLEDIPSEVSRQQLGEPIEKVSKARAEAALAKAEAERKLTLPKEELVEKERIETIPEESRPSRRTGRERELRKDHKKLTEALEALEEPQGTVYENLPPARINEQIELIKKKLEEIEKEALGLEIELKEIPDLKKEIAKILEEKPFTEIDVTELPPPIIKELFPEIKIDLKKEAKGIMLSTVRKRKAEIAKTFNTTRKWKENLTDKELKDIGAAVEKIGNLDIKGDTYESVQRRLNPKQKDVLGEYKKVQEQLRQDINQYLKSTGEAEYISMVENYLAHFYVGNKSKINAAAGRFKKNSPNAQKRKLPTLQDAVDAGLKPLTQNVAELVNAWAEINWRVATNRKLAFDLKELRTPEGELVITKSSDAPIGYKFVDYYPLRQIYGTKTKEGKPILFEGNVAVHPDIYPAIKMLYGDMWNNKGYRGVALLNAWGKKTALSFSLFHHAALTESAQAVLARGKNPLRGLFVIGEIDPITGKRVAITQPHRIGKRLTKDNVFLEDAISHGLQIGSTSDAQLGRINKSLSSLEARTRDIPFAGYMAKKAKAFNQAWDKALWDNYHSGLKAYAYHDIVGDMIKRYPKENPKIIKEKVAEYLNDAFGGQEWEAKLWADPKMQQSLQAIILAPDWTISNLNIAGMTPSRMKQLAKDPIKRRLHAKYWRNMIPTLIASHTGLQLAIYMLAGDEERGDKPFNWDNEVDKKLDIDVTPLYRSMPWNNPNDKTRRYVHFGKQARETLGWVKNPIETLYRKSSPVVKIATEQILEEEGISGFPAEYKENIGTFPYVDQPGKEIALRGKALVKHFIPFSWRGSNFAFTAPMSKGMTNWKATRAMEKALDYYADPTPLFRKLTKKIKGDKKVYFTNKLDILYEDIIEAAILNGIDPTYSQQYALGNVVSKYYRLYFKALEEQDEKNLIRYEDALLRLSRKGKSLRASMERKGYEFKNREEWDRFTKSLDKLNYRKLQIDK